MRSSLGGDENYAGLAVILGKSVNLSRKGRVRVIAGPRLIEFAGPERVRRLAAAPNAKVIRKHKTQEIVAIILEPYGDDSRVHERDGNPQRLSHNHETADNPRRVRNFKKFEPPV